MRVAKFVFFGGGLIVLAFFGWTYLADTYFNQEKIANDIKVSAVLLEAGQPHKALNLLKNQAAHIDTNSAMGKEWLSLLAHAYSETEDTDSLLFLYKRFPQAFDKNEAAAQDLAATLIKNKQLEDYTALRHQWQGKENNTNRWIFLDSEALAAQGNFNEAASLLTMRNLTGKEETNRLVRLALLYVIDDPKLAWNYLSEASIKDPDNADLNTFKANLLSSIGKKDMALAEYIQAIQKNPQNLYLREQLADVYLHEGNYVPAIEVMEDTLYAPSTDAAWVKALFWSRMTLPLKGDWKITDIPKGPLTPLANYIFELPKNVYWNASTFDRTPGMSTYLKTRQETFWLRLIEALKKGQDVEAENLLNQNPFQTTSWAPAIENSLKAALEYRKNRTNRSEENLSLPLPRVIPKVTTLGKSDVDISMQQSKEQFKTTLKELYEAQKHKTPLPVVTQDIDQLLLSKEAFAAILLAYDWQEAALQLHKLHIIAPTFPDWVVYYLTSAMQQNRGSKVALQFATPQKSSPETSLLIAHLAQSLGMTQTALDELATISKRKDEIGYLAAQQMSKLYLEQDDIKAAKEAILLQPLLANDLRGKEMLARLALIEGNTAVANSLYASIEAESSEAKSFLIRKAYTEKDWKKARQLTEELLVLHPDNQLLQENLQKIIVEQRRTQVH